MFLLHLIYGIHIEKFLKESIENRPLSLRETDKNYLSQCFGIHLEQRPEN